MESAVYGLGISWNAKCTVVLPSRKDGDLGVVVFSMHKSQDCAGAQSGNRWRPFLDLIPTTDTRTNTQVHNGKSEFGIGAPMGKPESDKKRNDDIAARVRLKLATTWQPRTPAVTES